LPFIRIRSAKSELIEKIYSLVNADAGLKKQFKDRIGNKEIFKFIKDTIENSQNILLMLDNEKAELPEIINTYTDTWGKIVKLTLLKEYTNNGDSIISLTPEFANIVTDGLATEKEAPGTYTEDYHLEGTSPEIKEAYRAMHDALSLQANEIIFNPLRYYISLRKKKNFAFIHIKKSKMTIVAMMDQSSIEERIKHHKINPLAASVQKFYNGPCAQIVITDNSNMNEIISLLVEIQK
jgi:predicted transport protein